ncbi:MAG: hypothetical protein JST92_10225 [Deltaproteobacteria bacterium]|nr:hypothetical protein [Deltaproteobacteria bacterium]
MATGPLEHATELVERPKRMGFGGFLRHASQRIRHYANAPQPPPDRGDKWERIFYGAAHPLLGFKLVLRDPELLKDALVPAFWLFAFCSVVALMSTDDVYTGHRKWLDHLRNLAPFLRAMLPDDADAGLWIARVKTFYKTFAVLAAAPSVVFANHYARLAALVRWRLGLGACGPRELPWSTLIKRVIEQAILVAVTLLPVTWALHILPFGGHLSNLLLGAWGLHWVVVEAFDDARVLKPGETVEQAERAAEFAPRPWFVRAFQWLGARFPDPRSLPARVSFRFAAFIDRLSKPWREEIALLEKHPLLGTGFALATATLLATPILNFIFRPVIIAGGTHLLAHLEAEEEHDLALAEAAEKARMKALLDEHYGALGPPPQDGPGLPPLPKPPDRER